MTLRSFTSLALIISLFATSAPLARAQSGAEPAADDATRDRARAIFAEGVSALDTNDCPTALSKFREAYGLIHEPSILYNLATAESECHDIVDAVGHYQAFLDQVRSGRSARFRPDARRQVVALTRRLGHLSLRVDGLMSTDEVTVDGRAIETTPAALADVLVAAGDHVVVVRRDGTERGRTSVTTAEGERATVTVSFSEPVRVPTPEAAAASVADETTRPGPLDTPSPNRRRRRIIIGSSVAGAVVIGAVIAIVATR